MGSDVTLISVRKLRAAYWVGRVLGQKGESERVLRLSWMSLPLAGEVDIADLDAALSALRSVGLVRDVGGVLMPSKGLLEVCKVDVSAAVEPLLALVLEESRPLWLVTAAGEGTRFRPELLPSQVALALEYVFPDAAKREAFLLARAQVVDADLLKQLGEMGEEAVVVYCQEELRRVGRAELAALVQRVSLISDELGYDVIAPRLDRTMRRLEVKATRSEGDSLRVFVTRNEVRVALSDPDWFLVVVRVLASGSKVVGWLSGGSLEHLLPEDRDDRGEWRSARLRFATQELSVGLPPVSKVAS